LRIHNLVCDDPLSWELSIQTYRILFAAYSIIHRIYVGLANDMEKLSVFSALRDEMCYVAPASQLITIATFSLDFIPTLPAQQ
jgi:hypothetical protein